MVCGSSIVSPFRHALRVRLSPRVSSAQCPGRLLNSRSPARSYSQKRPSSTVLSYKGQVCNPGLLRRAFLGGLVLTAGAMPFTTSRINRASAADLTAEKVRQPAAVTASFSFFTLNKR